MRAADIYYEFVMREIIGYDVGTGGMVRSRSVNKFHLSKGYELTMLGLK